MNARRVVLKSRHEIELMREANRHAQEILELMVAAVAPGVSTWDLDQLARREIARRPVESAFLGYRGYPAVICASINQEIVHGIPSRARKLAHGDVIGLDFGVSFAGFVGDTARTVAVGRVSEAVQRLLAATWEALEQAIAVCQVGNRLSDIGRAVEMVAERHRLGVVRDFVGHGIGRRMHEEPQVPNYFDGPKPRLREGLVIAIEPMFNLGGPEVRMLADGWTAVTRDGSWSAHFEDSIAICAEGPWVLSRGEQHRVSTTS